MKYCRHGDPLGRPGFGPLHLRYGKMRPISSSVSRTFLALENGPQGIDCALEMELAELSPEEAAQFREGPSALDRVINHLKDVLGLIVLIRVVLSFSLEVEMDGVWPWRRRAAGVVEADAPREDERSV